MSFFNFDSARAANRVEALIVRIFQRLHDQDERLQALERERAAASDRNDIATPPRDVAAG